MLTAAAFADWVVGPVGPGSDGEGTGGLAAVVDLAGAAPDLPPDRLRDAARAVPGVLVGLTPGDPPPSTVALSEALDVVVGPTALDSLVAAVSKRPLAAAALAMVLRGAGEGPPAGRLAAESAVYSMLQAGPEFASWRAVHAQPATDAEPGIPVLVERVGDRLAVVLSRPAVHNALDAAARQALVEALRVGVADPGLTVVLTGAGPSFCSGGDLTEFGTAPDPVTAHLVRLTRSPALLAARLGPRLEARIHGACLGAGVELAAFAGRVVASPDAFFALPELGFGLIPGSGGTVSLPARIGRHRTAWLALTGERITAATAREWGLVDEIAEV